MNRAVARTNAQMNSICWVITVNYISTMTSFYYGLAAILDTLYGVRSQRVHMLTMNLRLARWRAEKGLIMGTADFDVSMYYIHKITK